MRLMLAAVAAFALSACVERVEQPSEAELVARGDYLVNNVAGCNDCHTPMTAQGPDMSHALQGAVLVIAPLIEVPWAERAPQIAGGPLGMDDDQFAHFLQTGEYPGGTHARPPMPQFRFNEADSRAVVAYIKTLPRAEEAPAPAAAP